MLLRKEGFPEENELVLCTVTAIHYHSVFVKLEEYDKQGMIHISEISPGRIRNIGDYVKEGKKIICKVLKVSMDKGHIDLSLRRVNDNQKKQKASEIKQEQLAESIIEFVAKQRKTEMNILYKEILEKIQEEYDSMFEAFDDVAAEKATFDELGIDKELGKQLTEVIMQRIKPVEIEIGGDLKLKSFEPNGVEIIKEAVKNAGNKAEINYKGAGTYVVKVKSLEYKEAEKDLKEFVEKITDYMESHNSKAEFVRVER